MSSRSLLEHGVPIEFVKGVYAGLAFARILKREETPKHVAEICTFGLMADQKRQLLRTEVQQRCRTLDQMTQYASICKDLAAWIHVLDGYVRALSLSCDDEILVKEAFIKMECIQLFFVQLEKFPDMDAQAAA